MINPQTVLCFFLKTKSQKRVCVCVRQLLIVLWRLDFVLSQCLKAQYV